MKRAITYALKLCIGVGLFSAIPTEIAAENHQEMISPPCIIGMPIRNAYPVPVPPQPAKTIKHKG